MYRVLAATSLLFLAAPPAFAQQSCDPPRVVVGLNLRVEFPAGPEGGQFQDAELLVGDTAVDTVALSESSEALILTGSRADLAAAGAQADGATFRWNTGQGFSCDQAVVFAQGSLAGGGPSAGGPNGSDERNAQTNQETTAGISIYRADQCALAGSEWWNEVRRSGRNRTLMVLRPGGGPCWWNRDYGVVGDPIHIAVFTNQPANWVQGQVSYDPCALEPEAPSVYASGRLADVIRGGLQDDATWELKKFAPRRCFNTSVAIVVEGNAPSGAVTPRATATLAQHNRYFATVHLGVGLIDEHRRSFGLRPDGSEQVVFDEGPVDEGPEYLATIVLYGFMHHVTDLFGGQPYKGRDILEENSLMDRLGLMVGVGLSDPGDQFTAGATLELVRGVNAVYGLYFLRSPELTGLEIGDVFAGSEDEIPTTDRWTQEWFWGFSLDLRYVLGLLGRQ